MLPVIPLAGLLFAAIGIAFSLRIPTIELFSFYFTLFLTPLLFFLPKATLAATIIVAVLSLVDLGALKRVFDFSKADFAQDNFADGLPLGINYAQHGLQVGIRRRIGTGTTLGLQSSFYHYSEPSSGGSNNFTGYAVFATLAIQLP